MIGAAAGAATSRPRPRAETDGKALRILNKLTLFRQFYIMVVCYIYFTRIIVYLLESTLPYRYIWMAAAAAELAALAFYIAMGFSFRCVREWWVCGEGVSVGGWVGGVRHRSKAGCFAVPPCSSVW